MSRKERVLKKRYAIFCEGDTEYNYINKMRKNQGVELVLKPINIMVAGIPVFLSRSRRNPRPITWQSLSLLMQTELRQSQESRRIS